MEDIFICQFKFFKIKLNSYVIVNRKEQLKFLEVNLLILVLKIFIITNNFQKNNLTMQIEDANLDKIHCKLYYDGISNFIFENVSKTHSNNLNITNS